MTTQLPTEADFLEDHGCLDAQEAWKNFGGLTVGEAYAKFAERPEIHSEDFAFMGEAAFAYYFEVLDRYVRDAIREGDERRYDRFSVVVDAIRPHFAEPWVEDAVRDRIRPRDAADGCGLRRRVVTLCDHVIESIPRQAIGSHPHATVTGDGLLVVWRGLRELAAAG